MNMDKDSIVSEWLRSLGLEIYSCAFYDNGYDELELCKQIEQPDLDAIGVFNPVHRKILLDSVKTLRSEGATSVYFTLEDVQRHGRTFKCDSTDGSKYPVRERLYDVSPHPQMHNHSTQSQLEFTKLSQWIRDKMKKENVDVTKSPYVLSTGEACIPVVTALAMRYADELHQNYFIVMSVIEEMIVKNMHYLQTSHTQPGVHSCKKQPKISHCQRDIQSSTENSRAHSDMFLGHATPPAIPASPPPNNFSATECREVDVKTNSKIMPKMYQRSRSESEELNLQTRMMLQPAPSHHAPLHHPAQGLHCSQSVQALKNIEHTCSRQRQFSNLQPYNVCAGGPSCSQLTHHQMCDNSSATQGCKEAAVFEQKRLEALKQVTAGKLTFEEAMNKIKVYEKQRNAICEKKGKTKKSTSAKIGEFFKLPSFRKKSKAKMTTPTSASVPEAISENPALSVDPLASDLSTKCTCNMAHADSAPHFYRSYSVAPIPSCNCEQCLRMLGFPYQSNSPHINHRIAVAPRASARFPQNKRGVIGADIVRASPSCRQCNTPLSQAQMPLPRFYSPQVTRKTYEPLQSPTSSASSHQYIKPVSQKYDAWYQKNLPSDDETRNLIDPNQSDDSSMNLSFEAFGLTPRNVNRSVLSPPISKSTPPANSLQDGNLLMNSADQKKGENTLKTTSDLGNSYHSDSLSSDDLTHTVRALPINNMAGEKSFPHTRLGRRDSGCYLSNENLNNNSSNSSTCEKKLQANRQTTAEKIPEQQNVIEAEDILDRRLRNMMLDEGIDLTCAPYTDEDGQWCVPISLVSRYAKVFSTDLTSIALAMDAVRCSNLMNSGRGFCRLTAETKRSSEPKTINTIHDFMVLSGLPMYTELLRNNGYTNLNSLSSLSETDLRNCGIIDQLHLDIILSAINSTWGGQKSTSNTTSIVNT